MSGTPETARILRVRLDAEGGTARIQVVDSGKGSAPEHRERLFSQGFTTREDGQGLGLYSKRLLASLLAQSSLAWVSPRGRARGGPWGAAARH